MLVSFLGYVLPWGQMSFWGAAVISNFLRIIPLIGEVLVFLVVGGLFSWGVDVKVISFRSFFFFSFSFCVCVSSFNMFTYRGVLD